MRKIILFIDVSVMIILSLSFSFGIIVWIHKFWSISISSGILLFYYSIIKSVLGIILFIKNIFQKNIIIISIGTSFLFIPSLILILFMGYYIINTLLNGWYIGSEMMIQSIILIIGIITLLSYFVLNKTFIVNIYHKIIFGIILPVSYFLGYWAVWIIILA
jgi:hypothetical protein